MKYYAAFKKKKLCYRKQHDYISVLKERHPKTKNIYCIKFKTGKANLEGRKWEEHEGDFGALIMFYIWIWVMVTQVCTLVKITELHTYTPKIFALYYM